jgi:CheY-like chemotaxis protein
MTTIATRKDAPSGAGFHILLVEDDDDDVYVLESVLMSDRRVASVARATNGEEALAWIEHGRQRADLILVDLNMPILDGHGFLTRFRMLRGQKNVPVAVLTSSGAASDYHRSLVRRADTFITKPSEYAGLVSVVGQLLDHLTWEVRLPVLLAA